MDLLIGADVRCGVERIAYLNGALENRRDFRKELARISHTGFLGREKRAEWLAPGPFYDLTKKRQSI